MTATKHPLRQREEATKSVRAKVAAKRKPTATKKPSVRKDRLTQHWLSAKGAEVKPKDKVRTKDGFVLTVLGRWSKKSKDGGVVPFITGTIVTAPKGATATAKGGSKNRAVPASDVTHTR
jgi:hypothetical protein